MLASLLALAPAASGIEFDYENFAGLKLKLDGIPIVEGSSFQYYEEGWKRGIYSSNWAPKTIEKLPNQGLRVRWNGDNGQAIGNIVLERITNGVKATYEIKWRGDKPVRLENTFGLIWAPAVEKGSLRIDRQDGLPMDRPFLPEATIEQRALGVRGKVIEFDTPYAQIEAKITDADGLLFDARGYKQDWAVNKELFWLGFQGAQLIPQQSLRYSIEWTVIGKQKAPSYRPKFEATLDPKGLSTALTPSAAKLPLIPKPKKQAVGGGVAVLPAVIKMELPPAASGMEKEFNASLASRWNLSTELPSNSKLKIVGSIQNLGLPAEGYRVSVGQDLISVKGQDLAGLRHGLRTLVWLVEPQAGKLVVPFQEIEDYPSLSWRGLHMFVGPTALNFQTKMMDRYFGPLKINRVVLQCERTTWKTLPGIETNIYMKRDDLKSLFDNYRSRGIDPIPLIQSLGHTYWIFANGQNLDIAINPDEAFTLDPRKQRTRDVLKALWSEVIDLTKPNTIHFGLDEIDMRGMPDDPFLTTRLWQRHLPWLISLAKELKVKPMMWGDIMLAPGEAPDAANAKDPAVAKERRNLLPPGTMIADWHYKDDPKPETFNSLQTWKKAGMTPIASTWFRQNNIRGFALAAIQNGTPGLLQTTWAGYESSEEAMVREFDQFAAYTLAADYAWSGRTELPSQLPYDPRVVLTRLYFSPPEPIKPVPGTALMPIERKEVGRKKIGPISFDLFEPIVLNTPLEPGAFNAPEEAGFVLNNKGRELVVAVDCWAWVKDNEPVAEISVKTSDGRYFAKDILYGQHVRANRDKRATLLAPRENGLSAFRIDLSENGGSSRIVEVRIKRKSAAAGLRIHGLTLVD